MLADGNEEVLVHFATLEHCVLRFLNPLPAALIAIGQGAVADEILGAIILELDRIGAGLGGCIDHATGKVQIAIVIDADLRNQKCGMAGTDQSPTNGDSGWRHSRCSCHWAGALYQRISRPAFLPKARILKMLLSEKTSMVPSATASAPLRNASATC